MPVSALSVEVVCEIRATEGSVLVFASGKGAELLAKKSNEHYSKEAHQA
jgi:hypothetical protein